MEVRCSGRVGGEGSSGNGDALHNLVGGAGDWDRGCVDGEGGWLWIRGGGGGM